MREYQVDLQLIDAVKRGDSHAFDVLVQRYQPRVMKIVSRYVRDPSEVLDVTQEVFIKAYRALKKFRGIAPFIPGFIELPSIPQKTTSFRKDGGCLISISK